MSINTLTNELPLGVTSYEVQRQREIERTSTLGQEDFLKLMTTQLQNQDPLKPMENGDFLAQMAQFSTVAGIEEMNQSITGMADTFQSQQITQAASVIGKRVLVDGDAAQLEQGHLEGAVQLDSAATYLQISIRSDSGELVKTLDLGKSMAGLREFSWDGITDDGGAAPPGTYFITAQAGGNGAIRQPSTMTYGQVESVQVKEGLVTVNLAGRDNVNFNNVKRISQ